MHSLHLPDGMWPNGVMRYIGAEVQAERAEMFALAEQQFVKFYRAWYVPSDGVRSTTSIRVNGITVHATLMHVWLRGELLLQIYEENAALVDSLYQSLGLVEVTNTKGLLIPPALYVKIGLRANPGQGVMVHCDQNDPDAPYDSRDMPPAALAYGYLW